MLSIPGIVIGIYLLFYYFSPSAMRAREIRGFISDLSDESPPANPHEPPHYRRMYAATKLGIFKAANAVAPLVERLPVEPHAEVRKCIAFSLGEIGAKSAFEPLLKAYETDEVLEVRCAALKAMGQTRDPRALDILLARFNNTTTAPEVHVTFRIHDPVVELRSFAVQGLGAFGGEKVLAPILEALKDRDAGIRHSAALALLSLGDKRGIEPLRKAVAAETGFGRDDMEEALQILEGKRPPPEAKEE
jgi:hypothetical protein